MKPMRVLLLNQFFYPDLAASAQLMTDLAIVLAKTGAEVTALTSQSSYIGASRYPARGNVEGVRILRVPSTNYGRGSVVGRMTDYLSYYASCAAQMSLLQQPHVCISLSNPPLVSLLGAGAKLASLAKARFIYWVQDLYPDIAVQFGLLSKASPVTLGLEALSRTALRVADAVVVLEEAMAARVVSKGVRRDKVHIIPNWSDGDEIGQIDPRENWFLDRHALRGAFVVLYSGNMGRGHEFETLLGAAHQLTSRRDIVFLFIGEGAKLSEIEAFAKTHPNVRLLPYQRRDDLPYSLGSGGICAITLSDGLEGMIVPSKLYGGLAARKPVLFIGPAASEVARVLQRERCRWRLSARRCSRSGLLHRTIGWECFRGCWRWANGDEGAFDQNYSRKLLTARFVKLCESLCRERAS